MTTLLPIVVATDFSPGSNAAVERAVQLAMLHGVRLCLLHAFDTGAWHGLKAILNAQRPVADSAPDARIKQRLADLASQLTGRTGTAVGIEFGTGTAHRAIADYVEAHPESLVVIGSRFDPSIEGIGSTASKVLRTPSCPVLIVRTAGAAPYEKILVAVDLQDGSVRAATTSLALFPAASHHLVHAVPAEFDHPWLLGELQPREIQLLLESRHGEADKQLQALALRLGDGVARPPTFEVASDAPSRAVVVAAAALPADCVVVGRGEPGASGHGALGSMAQHVVQFTDRDVLVVP